jgi:lipoate-protein ligase A
MRCLISNSHNPYFNLATEEYFLKNGDEELFLLYLNEPSVVVGKHQNLLAEINIKGITNNQVKLARRITGGGAVYQDLNNLNFSFIHNCPERDKINFKVFTNPILEALKSLGLEAEFSGRNDLLVEEKKISGNAMHIYKSRVLSHGTLLFNSDLNMLSDSLKNDRTRYADKAIKSVRSPVTNILSHLKPAISIEEFTHKIFTQIVQGKQDTNLNRLSEEEEIAIQHIAKEKFETWDWIYGYSPKYVFQNSIQFGPDSVTAILSIEKGIILNAKFEKASSHNEFFISLEKSLFNIPHDLKMVRETIEKVIEGTPNLTLDVAQFCAQLF